MLNVVSLPLSPEKRIELVSERCPALKAIAVKHLLSAGTPWRAMDVELLAALFQFGLMGDPRQSYDEACDLFVRHRVITFSDVFAVLELDHVAADPDMQGRCALWHRLLSLETAKERRCRLRFFIALLSLLYRHEGWESCTDAGCAA